MLPAGPTPVDMVANALFFYGLLRVLVEAERPLWSYMSFDAAHENFTSAARNGLDATLYWPGTGWIHPDELVLRKLLPMAAEGLARWGVASEVCDRYLPVDRAALPAARRGRRGRSRPSRRWKTAARSRTAALHGMFARCTWSTRPRTSPCTAGRCPERPARPPGSRPVRPRDHLTFLPARGDVAPPGEETRRTEGAGSGRNTTSQVPARRERDADPLVQRAPRPAEPTAASAAPGHRCSRSGPDDLAPLFPMDLILQEVSTEQYVDIPDEVLDVYRLWRPSPLYRAHRLEKALGTPARIYYKYEGVSPAGSHKPNTAVPQAFYNAKAGIRRLTTETGAGQWGTALAFACAQFGLDCEVWQVRRVVRPEALPADDDRDVRRHRAPLAVRTSPRRAGAILAEDPDSPGSLGIAISEAVEVAAQDPTTSYALGSVLNHVLLHQTIIGEEALLAARHGRRVARPPRRLHRRRVELRRAGLPVPAGEAGRAE